MNKRIKKLIAQCTETWDDVDPYDGYRSGEHFYREKFAELIIQECVGVADAYVRGDVDSPWYSPTARSRIGIKIQEHFGIKDESENT